jgi:pseudaminic acid cytidylyltransferase
VIAAVIPARGGSKRIPRKNLKEFRGKPVLAWSIEAALTSELFDHVIVSTEDEVVAETARAHGADVPFMRPEALAGDHVGIIEVIDHATRFLREQGDAPEVVCCIFATAPLIDPGNLAEGLRKLQDGDWQYVFGATTFAYPVQRAFTRSEKGGVDMMFPENIEKRSQDLPEVYHDAGQFYWGRSETWISGDKIFSPRSTVVMVPRWRAQDIDTPEDWDFLERLATLASLDQHEHPGTTTDHDRPQSQGEPKV